VRVREGRIRVEVSMHSRVIAHWVRYREGRWVRVVVRRTGGTGAQRGQ